VKQIEHIGRDSIQFLGECIKDLEVERIFLVAGKNSFQLSGVKQYFETYTDSIKIFRFSDFDENPRLQDVEKGVQLLKEINPDVIVAIGGGTTIDIAKLINIFSAQADSISSIINDESKIFAKGKTVIAIPTTSGSGSESTHFAVLYIDGVKKSIAHPSILPSIAIVDPQFTYLLSKKQTAISGVDAFCQAIESYWSINSTNESKEYARTAIDIIIHNLPGAVNQSNKKNRDAMSFAAHLAGKAINISKTTAPHALSYTMTSRYGVPHGQAVSITLPSFFEYNYFVSDKDVVDKRGLDYVKITMNELLVLLNCNDIMSAKKFLLDFMLNIGLSTKFDDLGIFHDDRISLVNAVNVERLSNNPRLIKKSNILNLLENI
jgi:alcohol dehydrogenase class IV